MSRIGGQAEAAEHSTASSGGVPGKYGVLRQYWAYRSSERSVAYPPQETSTAPQAQNEREEQRASTARTSASRNTGRQCCPTCDASRRPCTSTPQHHRAGVQSARSRGVSASVRRSQRGDRAATGGLLTGVPAATGTALTNC